MTAAVPTDRQPRARHYATRLAVVLTVGLLVSTVLHAGRPLQTEDADVLDAGTCEIEAGADRLRGHGERATELSVDGACGVAPAVQLSLGWARVRTGGQVERGAGLGAKWGVWEGSEGAGLALTLALDAARAPGRGWRRTGHAIGLAHSRPAFGDGAWHVAIAHAHDRGARASRTEWGLGLQAPPWGAVTPMVELVGTDREAPAWNGGLMAPLSDDVAVDLSIGQRIATDRARRIGIGLTLVF